jgi:hypothetical protein
MPLDIRFAYVCHRKFAELQGESELKRYCDSCRLEVINLDPLDDRARLELFERATGSTERLCVAATVPVENGRSCLATLPPPQPTAGLPKMPPPEILRAERERIERESMEREARAESGGAALSRLLAKIKFW